MAFSARADDETKEYFDSPEELDKKITELSNAIRKSKHFIAFTGAGVSTSCGVPDFRSGKDTVLETGAGVWTREAADKKGEGYKKGKSVSMLKAMPGKTHMALVALHQAGYLKHLVSQNVDGLHRISGFPIDALDELHGNCKLEVCVGCQKQYMRDFEVYGAIQTHYTGRTCSVPDCKGKLKDTIIHFGESLPEKELQRAFDNATNADVCLAIGSSLTVTPAANVPKNVGKKDNSTLCIVNLQKTPLDKYSKIRVYAKCDDVMQALLAKLQVPLPEWYLERCVRIQVVGNASSETKKASKNERSILITAMDRDDITPASIFDTIEISYGKHKKSTSVTLYQLETTQFTVEKKHLNEVQFEFSFLKHYNEPNWVVKLMDLTPKNKQTTEQPIESTKSTKPTESTESTKSTEPIESNSNESTTKAKEEAKEEVKEEKVQDASKEEVQDFTDKNWEVWVGLKYSPLKGVWEEPVIKKWVGLNSEGVEVGPRKKSIFGALANIWTKPKDNK